MGLAERRAIKAFQDEKFEDLKKKVCDAAGFPIEFEVNWDSIAHDDYGHMYNEAFAKVYFEPLAQSFASICADDMGKEALQAELKKIVIQDLAGKSSAPSCYTFKDGVLTVDHRPVTNIDSILDRTKGLTQMLEKAL